MVFSPFIADATKFLKGLKKNFGLKNIKKLPSIANSRLGSGPKPAQISNSVPKKCLTARLIYNDFCAVTRKKEKKKKKKVKRENQLWKKKVGSFFPPSNFHRMYVVEEHYLFACFDVKQCAISSHSI